MSKFKHPVSGLLYGCLACYERDGDNRLNKHLSQADIAENIRVAIDSLEADTPVKPCSGCPEGYEFFFGRGNVDTEKVQSVLDGNLNDLTWAFDWSREKHGHAYWEEIELGYQQLTDTDREFLEHLRSDHHDLP